MTLALALLTILIAALAAALWWLRDDMGDDPYER